MQHANQHVQLMKGGSTPKKRNNDTQNNARKALDEWTKKQRKTSKSHQVGYDKQKEQPL
jgi:hypothetical protein